MKFKYIKERKKNTTLPGKNVEKRNGEKEKKPKEIEQKKK